MNIFANFATYSHWSTLRLAGGGSGKVKVAVERASIAEIALNFIVRRDVGFLVNYMYVFLYS